MITEELPQLWQQKWNIWKNNNWKTNNLDMPHIHKTKTKTDSRQKHNSHELKTKTTANMLPFSKDCSTVSHRRRDKSAQLEAVVLGGTQSLSCGPLFFKAGFHLFENPRSIAHHQLHWACFQPVSHVRPEMQRKTWFKMQNTLAEKGSETMHPRSSFGGLHIISFVLRWSTYPWACFKNRWEAQGD